MSVERKLSYRVSRLGDVKRGDVGFAIEAAIACRVEILSESRGVHLPLIESAMQQFLECRIHAVLDKRLRDPPGNQARRRSVRSSRQPRGRKDALITVNGRLPL